MTKVDALEIAEWIGFILLVVMFVVDYIFVEESKTKASYRYLKNQLIKRVNKLKNLNQVRKYLSKEYRGYLSEFTASQYIKQGYSVLTTDQIKVPLIINEDWIPEEPIPLHKIHLGFSEESPSLPIKWDGLSERLKKEVNPNMFDALTYRLLQINKGLTIEFQFGLGTYFDYIDTCEAMAWDLAIAINYAISRQLGQIPFPEVLDHLFMSDIKTSLKYRSQVTDLLDFKNRSSAVGVNVLTIITGLMFEDDPDFFLIQKRGKTVVEAVNTISVVPGGTFQPFYNNDLHHNIEFSFDYTILREFGEEILDKKILESVRAKGLHPYAVFESDEELSFLRDMFQGDDVRKFYLGIGIDTITLKPELMILLLINGKKLVQGIPWMKEKIEGNWEGEIYPESFTIEKLTEYLGRPETIAVAKGCMALALKNFYWIQAELRKIDTF